MTVVYCSRDEVFNLGLSAQAFVIRPRPFDAIDITTGTIRLKGHGFSALDAIAFEVTSGGSLPTGLTAFTTYNPVITSFDLFKVSGFNSYVSGGSGWGIAIDPGRRIDMHALEVSAEIDEHLTDDDPPLKVDPITGKYPQVVVGLAARMTARAAVLSLQIENAQYRVAVDRLFERQAKDLLMLDEWRKGKPINPRPVDQTESLDNAAIASAGVAINWMNRGDRGGML
jgi:hypothetical protein